MSKRLLILGAGPFQIGAIRKAVAIGHEVVTLDYSPASIGHRFSHRHVICSTADVEGVTAAARELRVDGICTFSSDVAVPAVAHACAELGLPGPSPEVVRRMSLKHEFRALLRECDLPHPAFVSGESVRDIRGSLSSLRLPIIVKPVDTSGSRGVTALRDLDEARLERALLHAREYSRSGTVCVEEFVNGVEVGGDAILLDGRIAFMAITHKHMDGFVVTGHSLPASIGPDEQARVKAAVEACCRALGYTNGVLNFDVMVTDHETCILEMSARNGGNGIPAIIAHATGVDPEVAAIRMSLGDQPGCEPAREPRGAGSWVFGSDSPGTLLDMAGFEEVRNLVPELLELFQAVPSGGTVRPFTHGGNLVGYALFDCPHPGDYPAIRQRIREAVRLSVASS